MHTPYEHFCSLFGTHIDLKLGGTCNDNVWASFDKKIEGWIKFLWTPALMALFIVVLNKLDLKKNESEISDSLSFDTVLYKKTIEIMVHQHFPDSVDYDDLFDGLKVVSCMNHAAGRRDFF